MKPTAKSARRSGRKQGKRTNKSCRRGDKKASEAASRGNVLLARHSKDGGKNGQALAQLAQALRLNPENREASALTTAMVTQLNWHVPLTGSLWHET